MPSRKKTKSGAKKSAPAWLKNTVSRLKAGFSWARAKIAAGLFRVKEFLIARRNAIKDFFSVLWDLPYFPELSRFTLALRRNLIALCGVILFLLLFDIEVNFRDIFGLKIKGLAKYETYMAALAVVFYVFVHYFYSLISEMHKRHLDFYILGNSEITKAWNVAEQSAKMQGEDSFVYLTKRFQKTHFWLFNIDLPLLLSVGAMIWLGVEIYHNWS